MTNEDSFVNLSQNSTATAQVLRVGYIGAVLATITGYTYLLGYILLLVRYPIQPWGGIKAFADSYITPYGTKLTILQALAFLQTLSIAVTVIALAQCARPREKVFARLAETAVTAFVILSCSHYFIQWASVRQSILKGNLDGLSQFVQFNFDSPLSAFNMLGWTLFYGLTALSISVLFRGRGKESWIKWGLVVCGIIGIAAFVGLAAGKQIAFLIWTLGISITWYIYPVMMAMLRQMLREVKGR